MTHDVELPTSLRAINDRYVGERDFGPLFADIFDTLLYHQRQQETPQSPERPYEQNRAFWDDIRESQLHQGSRVVLHNVHLTEWIPSAPGRYFTPEAAESRQRAQWYWEDRQGEYVPLGKESMVLGGVGCLRLRERDIDNRTVYLLGATANGVAHQGIPVVVRERDIGNVLDLVKDHGGCICNVFGVVRILPTELALIQYDRPYRRCAVYADGIEIVKPSEPSDLAVSVAIMFPSDYPTYNDTPENYSGNGYETRLPKSWSFASFTPDRQDQDLASTAEWLREYAGRYSRQTDPPILSDFDEHRSHFDSPVEFPLRQIQRQVDPHRLHAYATYYNLTINEGAVVMGDIFQGNYGSTIVNRSKVENSFQHFQDAGSPDIASALVRLAEVVTESNNKDAGELLDAFNDEIAQEQPKKGLLRNLWQGLVTAVPAISQMTDVVEKITNLFSGNGG